MKTDWSAIKFKVRSIVSLTEKKKIRKAFAEFITAAGGVSTIVHATSIPEGSIKGVQGNKERLISPVLAHRLSDLLKGSIDAKYTREFLRPDITQLQWDRLDAQIRVNTIDERRTRRR